MELGIMRKKTEMGKIYNPDAVIATGKALKKVAVKPLVEKFDPEKHKDLPPWGIVQLVLYCPAGHQHIDEGEWTTRPHKTHQCQATVSEIYTIDGGWSRKKCGREWRPANFNSVGVKVLNNQIIDPVIKLKPIL